VGGIDDDILDYGAAFGTPLMLYSRDVQRQVHMMSKVGSSLITSRLYLTNGGNPSRPMPAVLITLAGQRRMDGAQRGGVSWTIRFPELLLCASLLTSHKWFCTPSPQSLL